MRRGGGVCSWRYVREGCCAFLIVGLAVIAPMAVPATEPSLLPPSPSISSAIEAAQGVKRRAEMMRQQRQAAQATTLPAPSGIKRREGLFYFVSWSIPDQELKRYLREAFHLGATVVFRGMIDDDMRKTIDRTKAMAVELDKEAPHTTIDPVIFRQFGVTAVPALAIAKDQQAVFVEGAAPLTHLLTLLAREERGVTPLLEWAEGKGRSWDRGGPITEPRPVMPVLVGMKHVPATLTRYPIAERDMEALIKERIRQVDWAAKRRELDGRVRDKLKEGPGLVLPKAIQSRAFTVDLTQRYEHDIPNHDGSAIVVKAGTEINPLLYVSLHDHYLVIDGRDSTQVSYAKAQLVKYGALHVKVMLTAGEFQEVSKALQHRIFWAQPEILARFQLTHVPSLISQNGPMLQIDEVAL